MDQQRPPRQSVPGEQEKDISTYTLNTHRIRHHSCSRCGCGPSGEAKAPSGAAMASTNMHCVEGFEPEQV
jgi:hypothetical protein